jgi:hypothetical protein
MYVRKKPAEPVAAADRQPAVLDPETVRRAIRKRTEKLRALRLAREAEARAAAPPPKKRAPRQKAKLPPFVKDA